MEDILHAHYIYLSARCDGLLLLSHDIMKYFFFVWLLDSFEPLAPEPQVAHQLAKGTKEKTQTQGDEEYGEREDENRRDAAPLISPNRGPCCTT
jgi:hypothetical protein